MPDAEISAGHAAFLQIATAVVQAVVSVSLLAWYVFTAHLERVRVRRERSEDFDSLVRLCRDLGGHPELTASVGGEVIKGLAVGWMV
jgi:hypothetical protein